jgi:hypothetical protein
VDFFFIADEKGHLLNVGYDLESPEFRKRKLSGLWKP